MERIAADEFNSESHGSLCLFQRRSIDRTNIHLPVFDARFHLRHRQRRTRFVQRTRSLDSTDIPCVDREVFDSERYAHLDRPIILADFSSLAVHPTVLIFCSRLPILSQAALSTLEDAQIYPYGYPCTRTLPFRYLFERRVRNNRSTNLMSELWKKKLLDEQRTHVLKGATCTVKTIKYYFEQIWSQFVDEKRDDDDDDHHQEQKSWEDQYLQAFQQAKIQVQINRKRATPEKKPKASPKKPSRAGEASAINHASLQTNEVSDTNGEIVDQLNHLLTVISQVKEQIITSNASPVLKLNNHIQTSADGSLRSISNFSHLSSRVESTVDQFNGNNGRCGECSSAVVIH